MTSLFVSLIILLFRYTINVQFSENEQLTLVNLIIAKKKWHN